MINIACVLKSGGFDAGHFKATYSTSHVRWLRDQFERFLPLPHRFVCFTDVNVSTVECTPLRHGWKGWWSKMELFAQPGAWFYVDLDTVLVGDVSQLANLANEAQPGTFMALASMSKKAGVMGSGVMAWNGDFRFLYDEFAASPERHMRECVTMKRWGDQGFIQATLLQRSVRWHELQRRAPGQIVSFKTDMKQRTPPPSNARIVCFHGVPKPWDVKMSWVPALGE